MRSSSLALDWVEFSPAERLVNCPVCSQGQSTLLLSRIPPLGSSGPQLNVWAGAIAGIALRLDLSDTSPEGIALRGSSVKGTVDALFSQCGIGGAARLVGTWLRRRRRPLYVCGWQVWGGAEWRQWAWSCWMR